VGVLITGRQAAALLSDSLPTREHGRLVLRAGFAGEPERTTAALLYDEAAVRALAVRPPVSSDEVAAACPQGLYVARLPRKCAVDVRAPWSETASIVAVQPAMPTLTTALLAVRVSMPGGLPWVATLCGYVVLAAQAQGLRNSAEGTLVFDLVETGEWARAFTGRRLATRPGRPWRLLESGRAGLSARGGR